MRGKDVPFYLLAQFSGAAVGAAGAWFLWGDIAEGLRLGITMPGIGFSDTTAFVCELTLTTLRLAIVFACVSSVRTARWTPVILLFVTTLMVWFEAPVSGASLNSARSFGPALVATYWKGFWIYLLAPNLAAIGIGLLVRNFFSIRRIVTAMLYHPKGPCPHPNCLICEAAVNTKLQLTR
jgi:aquaporin Z